MPSPAVSQTPSASVPLIKSSKNNSKTGPNQTNRQTNKTPAQAKPASLPPVPSDSVELGKTLPSAALSAAAVGDSVSLSNKNKPEEKKPYPASWLLDKVTSLPRLPLIVVENVFNGVGVAGSKTADGLNWVSDKTAKAFGGDDTLGGNIGRVLTSPFSIAALPVGAVGSTGKVVGGTVGMASQAIHLPLEVTSRVAGFLPDQAVASFHSLFTWSNKWDDAAVGSFSKLNSVTEIQKDAQNFGAGVEGFGQLGSNIFLGRNGASWGDLIPPAPITNMLGLSNVGDAVMGTQPDQPVAAQTKK